MSSHRELKRALLESSSDYAKRSFSPSRSLGAFHRRHATFQPTSPSVLHKRLRSSSVDFQGEAERSTWRLSENPTQRSPLPQVGGTGEQFHVSSTLKDDLAVVAKARREPLHQSDVAELRTPQWGDERRWRNRASVMTEEFLEMLRPKYGSLLPDFLRGEAQVPSKDDGSDQSVFVSINRSAKLLGIPRRSQTASSLDITEPASSHRKESARRAMDKFAEIENALNVPDFTKYDSLYPGAIAEEARSGNGEKIRLPGEARLKVYKPHLQSTQGRAEETAFRIGGAELPVEKSLLERLDFVTNAVADTASPEHAEITEAQVPAPVDVTCDQSWLEDVERLARDPASLESTKKMAESEMRSMKLEAFGVTSEIGGAETTGGPGKGPPIIAFRVKEPAEDDWALLEEKGSNPGLLNAAFEVSASTRRQKEEQIEKERQAQSALKHERKLRREEKRLKKYTMKMNRDRLVRSQYKPLTISREKEEMEKLMLHHSNFSRWLLQIVNPLIRLELKLAKANANFRQYLRYLEAKGEVCREATAPLDWSDTEKEDFNADIRLSRPVFSAEMVRATLANEKEEKKRLDIAEAVNEMLRTSADYPVPPPKSRQSLMDFIADGLCRAGWVRQRTIPSPQYFGWLTLFRGLAILFEPSKSDVASWSVESDGLMDWPSHAPTQPLFKMNVLAIILLNGHTEVNEDSGLKDFAGGDSERITCAPWVNVLPGILRNVAVAKSRTRSRKSITIRGEDLCEGLLVGQGHRMQRTPVLTFTAASDQSLRKWKTMLDRVRITEAHEKRMYQKGLGPYDSFVTSLLDPLSQEIDFRQTCPDLEEFTAVLVDMDLSEADICHIDLSNACISSDWMSRLVSKEAKYLRHYSSWDLHGNPWPMNAERFLPQFLNATRAARYDFCGCDLQDAEELGRGLAEALISAKDSIHIICLSNNLLSSLFVDGFCRVLDALDEPVVGRTDAFLQLRDNSLDNEAANRLFDVVSRKCPLIKNIDVGGCPRISLKFLPTLMEKYSALSIPHDLEEESGTEKSVSASISLILKINPARDALFKLRRWGGVTPYELQKTLLPHRLASNLFGSVILYPGSRRLIIESCSGELFMNAALAENNRPPNLRQISLRRSDWLSAKTLDASRAFNESRGDVLIDARLDALASLVKIVRAKQLDISFCDFTQIPKAADVGRFLADLITDTELEFLDLTSTGLQPDHLVLATRILTERQGADDLMAAQMFTSTRNGQTMEAVRDKKKIFLKGLINEDFSGLFKQCCLRHIRLDNNKLGTDALLTFLRGIYGKCPRLHAVSVVNTSADLLELKKACRVYLRPWNDDLLIGDAPGSKKHAVEARLHALDNLDVVVTPEEILAHKTEVSMKWETDALEAREMRRRACHRLRANRLESFYSERAASTDREGVNARFPNSTASVRRLAKERLEDRLARLSKLTIPGGVFPPFRPPEIMQLSFGPDRASPKSALESFLNEEENKTLDISSFSFDSVDFEKFLSKLKEDVAPETEARLDAFYAVNSGIDEFHLLDIGHLVSHLPFRVEALDLSVNRLALPTPEHREALQSLVKILDPRVLTIDANWFADSAELADLLFEWITDSRLQCISLRLNALGDKFGRQLLLRLSAMNLSQKEAHPKARSSVTSSSSSSDTEVHQHRRTRLAPVGSHSAPKPVPKASIADEKEAHSDIISKTADNRKALTSPKRQTEGIAENPSPLEERDVSSKSAVFSKKRDGISELTSPSKKRDGMSKMLSPSKKRDGMSKVMSPSKKRDGMGTAASSSKKERAPSKSKSPMRKVGGTDGVNRAGKKRPLGEGTNLPADSPEVTKQRIQELRERLKRIEAAKAKQGGDVRAPESGLPIVTQVERDVREASPPNEAAENLSRRISIPALSSGSSDKENQNDSFSSKSTSSLSAEEGIEASQFPEPSEDSLLHPKVKRRYGHRVWEAARGSSLEILDLRQNEISKQVLVEISRCIAKACPNLKSLRIAQRISEEASQDEDMTKWLLLFGAERPTFVEIRDQPLPGVIPFPTKLLADPKASKSSRAKEEVSPQGRNVTTSPKPFGSAKDYKREEGTRHKTLKSSLKGAGNYTRRRSSGITFKEDF